MGLGEGRISQALPSATAANAPRASDGKHKTRRITSLGGDAPVCLQCSHMPAVGCDAEATPRLAHAASKFIASSSSSNCRG